MTMGTASACGRAKVATRFHGERPSGARSLAAIYLDVD